MNRWSKSDILDLVFRRLQREQILRIRIEGVWLDSTIIKMRSYGTGAAKKSNKPLASLAVDGLPSSKW